MQSGTGNAPGGETSGIGLPNNGNTMPQLSHLFQLDILDESDDLEISMENAFNTHIKPLLNSPPSTQVSSLNHILHSNSASSAKQQDNSASSSAAASNSASDSSVPASVEIFHGLVYGYMAAEALGIKGNSIFENLWNLGESLSTLRLLQRIALDKFLKLRTDSVRERFWQIVLKVVPNDSTGEGASLMEILLRFMRVSLWCNDKVMHFLHDHTNWVLKQDGMLQSAVYICLRLVVYHSRGVTTGATDLPQNPSSILQKMGQLEEQFCVKAIRGRFDAMMGIGRDFIRALHYASIYVPSLKEIYQQLMTNPQKFDAHSQPFVSVGQILSVPTTRRVLIAALTPDMERQLFFLMNKVKWGNQRRYQTWFAHMYFSAPGAQVCIVDLIRFTTVVYHPKMQKIQAGMVYRWGILGWLLTSINMDTDPEGKRLHHESLISVVFDWLFYNQKKDSFMNIEASLLLMFHSIPKYADLTISVLQMIFSHTKKSGDSTESDKQPSMDTFLLDRESITHSVQSALYKGLQKKIIPSIAPIMLFEKMPSALTEQMKQIFGGIEQQVTKDMQQLKQHHHHQASPQKPTPGVPPPATGTGNSSHRGHHHAGAPPSTSSPQQQKPSASRNFQRKPPGADSPSLPPSSDATAPTIKSTKTENSNMDNHQLQGAASDVSHHRDELQKMSTTIPQLALNQTLLHHFQPHLNDLANYITTMYQNGRKNPIVANKAQDSLVRVLEHYEREKDEIITEDNVQKLAHFLIQILSQEWTPLERDKRALLNMTLTRASDSLWFSMMAHIHRILSQPKQVGNAAVISKRSKSRYALLLRFMGTFHEGLGFRILSYCIRRNKCFLEEIQDLILSSASISVSDRHSKDILINILATKVKKPANPKKYLSFYEWSIQIRRQNDQAPRDVFINDMRSCAQEVDALFVILLPLVDKYFDSYIRDGEEGTIQFCKLICCNILPSQLYDVTSLVSTGRLKLLALDFRNDTLVRLVKEILTWDHYQQSCAFQLLQNELDRRTTTEEFRLKQAAQVISPVENTSETSEADPETNTPPALMKLILQDKTFDPKRNRELLGQLRHLFTCTYMAQRYTLTEDLVRFLLFLNPCEYGFFSATFIYYWMYNQSHLNARTGVFQVDQHLNAILEQQIGAKDTQQTENAEQIEYLLLNLLHLRNTEIETRIKNATQQPGKQQNAEPSSSTSPISSPHMLFSSMVLLRNLRRLREVSKFKSTYHLQSLINKLVEEIPGVEQKTITEIEDEESEMAEEEIESPVKPKPRTRSRKRKRARNDDEATEDQDVVPIAQRKKRRRRARKEYSEVSSESEESESMEDEEEDGEEEEGEIDEFSSEEENGEEPQPENESAMEDEEEESPKEEQKKPTRRGRGRSNTRARKNTRAKKAQEQDASEEEEEEEEPKKQPTRGRRKTRRRAAASKKDESSEEEDQESEPNQPEQTEEEESSEQETEKEPSAREKRAKRRVRQKSAEKTKKSTRRSGNAKSDEQEEESDEVEEEQTSPATTRSSKRKSSRGRRSSRRTSRNSDKEEEQEEEPGEEDIEPEEEEEAKPPPRRSKKKLRTIYRRRVKPKSPPTPEEEAESENQENEEGGEQEESEEEAPRKKSARVTKRRIARTRKSK